MQKLWTDLMLGAMMGMVVPGILLNAMTALLPEKPLAPSLPQQMQTQPQETFDILFRSTDGTVVPMDIQEYLLGVVLAEMPASFEEEALKAQAVVARTYALKAYTTGGKHLDGSVCGDPGCCQAYTTEEAYCASGGTAEAVEKVSKAVEDTSGVVVTYEGELIEATYFSCSGGVTEAAVAVWGAEYPYLQSVNSPGEEKAAYYVDTAVFTSHELEELLGVSFSDISADWIGKASYTAGGGVQEIRIGNRIFSGTELRQKLNLRSTAFSAERTENTVIFTTRGYGHRVGMSQYGADAMAKNGSTYVQILAHYYSGTEVRQFEKSILQNK